MTRAWLAALLLAASPAGAATVILRAFDPLGNELDLVGLNAVFARADEKGVPSPDRLPFWAVPIDDRVPAERVRLAAADKAVTASWDKGDRVRFELVWPVLDDGYNSVRADKEGRGYADGETLFLNEEIAVTQYRAFKESWRRRSTDWSPLYKPGNKAKDLTDTAKETMADAAREKEPGDRAKVYSKALHAIALASEKMLFEHGLQIALDEKKGKGLRFGLTLDENLLKRLDDLDWIAEAARRSGANWVRLVFRANPTDFTYASLRSFNEYDGALEALKREKLKVMGCVLDTTQWPKSLTPEQYAERVKNLVLHFKGRMDSWEVGSEINGDWLGGAGAPLTSDQVFRIYQAGASKVKELDPSIETAVSLYWWEETAPTREHGLSGWLKTFGKRGFGRDLDVVGLSLMPEDNPIGMGFERAFETLSEAMPAQKVMVSSLGYGETKELRGYWWLTPEDSDGARKDLLILYTAAACAAPRSLCGGFWWQALDQMLPSGRRKATDLFKVYRRTMDQLGRKE